MPARPRVRPGPTTARRKRSAARPPIQAGGAQPQRSRAWEVFLKIFLGFGTTAKAVPGSGGTEPGYGGACAANANTVRTHMILISDTKATNASLNHVTLDADRALQLRLVCMRYTQ